MGKTATRGASARGRRSAGLRQGAVMLEALEGRVMLSTANLLSNPSFSSGAASWVLSGDFWAGTNGTNYRTAPGYAVGGVDSADTAVNNATGYMYQQFTIPANATSVSASWWYYITTQESIFTSTAYDVMYVGVLDSSGNWLTTLAAYSNLNYSSGYQQSSTYNLSGYIGQTVRLAFEVATDSTNPTVFRIDDVNVTANVPTWYPDLTPYQPAGWSDKIVASTVTGTNTDSSPIYSDQDVYVDWAVINQGSGDATSTFYTDLYVDGVYSQQWYNSSLSVGLWPHVSDYDIGTLAAGTHTIQIVTDATNSIVESNETNNTYSKTITVTTRPLPDLAPYQPAGWSDKIVATTVSGSTSDSSLIYNDQDVYVDWAVINDGNADVTSTFYTDLYVDGTYTHAWYNTSLSAGSWTALSGYDLGTLSPGTHTIEIVTDANNNIAESNESNNSYTKTITVTAAAPVIGGLSPASYWASSNNQPMQINGSNFLSGATVTFRDPQGDYDAGTANFVSGTQLTWQFNDANDPGAWSVFVTNPDGQSSGTWDFTVAPRGYTATQIKDYYGLTQVAFGPTVADGTGQTIAIVELGDDPTLLADLAIFDTYEGLPAPPNLTIVGQDGSSDLPTAATDTTEESLDVEWAHAIAPGASILVVEATNLLTAVETAAGWPGVSIVSISYGSAETPNPWPDSAFVTPSGHEGVTFVASSGDGGSYQGNPGVIADGISVNTPASSPYVLAVGGTTLTSDTNGNPTSETGWGYQVGATFYGSGGGVSVLEPEPSYQIPVAGALSGRGVPDVAFDADGHTGVQQYDTGYGGWFEDGGTSLSAPCWAAIIAIVNQGRVLQGYPTLNGASDPTLPAIYNLPASDFNDITSGTNGGYNCTSGYDLVTGRGTPIANRLIPDLVAAEVPLPVVTGVYVAGSSWSSTFLDDLAAAGQGDATLGYRIPTGSSAQLNDLAWSDVNEISVRFSEDVDASQAALALTGVNVPSYAVSGFSYNPVTFTGTWTLAAPLNGDRVQIDLASSGPNAITAVNGEALDGEWSDGVSTVSGNGTAGGDFVFHLNVLPGDANGDGVVNGADFAILSGHFGSNTTAGASAGDFNGDGVVDFADFAILSNNFGATVPVGPASAPASNLAADGTPALPDGRGTEAVVSGQLSVVSGAGGSGAGQVGESANGREGDGATGVAGTGRRGDGANRRMGESTMGWTVRDAASVGGASAANGRGGDGAKGGIGGTAVGVPGIYKRAAGLAGLVRGWSMQGERGQGAAVEVEGIGKGVLRDV